MSVLVVHGPDRRPWVASLEASRVRLGRDPSVCEVALPGSTVSREHAVLERGPDGRWVVHCVSPTNPLVVDGALVEGSARLDEGSEILVGMEYLLILAGTPVAARAYMGGGTLRRSACPSCGWRGAAGGLRREPRCPRCGARDLRSDDGDDRRTAVMEGRDAATEGVDPWEVRAQLERMKVARQSRLEALDAKGRVAATLALREDAVARIGRGKGADLRLRGLALGAGIDVTWDGNRYVARSSLWFPSMTLDGRKCRVAPLAAGCVLAVGAHRFRYRVG
jgi:hypothetical protein